MIRDYLCFLKLYLTKKFLEDKNFKEEYSNEIYELLEINENTIGDLSSELSLLDMNQDSELAKKVRESKVFKTIKENQIEFPQFDEEE